MSHEPRAEERMITEFVALEASLDPAEVQAQVQAAGDSLVVVVDSDGQPVRLAAPGGAGPLLTAGPDTPLRVILDAPGMLEHINAGAPGVVIVEEDELIGVLTGKALRDYLVNEYMVLAEGLGDETLHGDFTQPRMVLECTTCGARNELDEFVAGYTQCVNGHLLTVDWG